MIRPLAVLFRQCSAALLLVSLSTALSLRAQDTRDQTINRAIQAYEVDFDAPRALELLYPSLNPDAGPADRVWATGVLYLTQIYFEDEDEDLAQVWLRWALRLAPQMRVDTLTFLPEIAAAAAAARQFVGSRTPGDDVTRTTWTWPVPGVRAAQGRATQGRIEIRAPTVRAPIQVSVGSRVLGAGQITQARPGSYNIQAAAEGYVRAAVTREVLPGITTVLTFNLAPTAVAEAQPQPGVPDSVLPDPVETRAFGQLARLSVRRFGAEPVCAAGFIVGTDGVVLTTYQAIRGAESVEAQFADGSRFTSGITVAAHDVSADVAVLKLPSPVRFPDSLALAREVVPGQYAWSLGFPNCGSAAAQRVRVGPGGVGPAGLELTDVPTGAELGGPVINQAGAVIGIGTGSMLAVPALIASAVLTPARRNIASRQLRTLGEVARQENHIYGSVAISATLAGATAHITPQESWHWLELAHSGLLPLTYAGPMGRYQLAMTLEGQVRHRSEFLIRPGLLERLTVSPDLLPEPQIAVQPSGGGGFPLPIALLGIAGAAAAVAVLAGGSGGDDGGPSNGGNGNGTGLPTTGGITISIPNP